MRPTVKLALATVDSLLCAMDDQDSLEFWRVLTALRHDDSNTASKSKTTSHVRKAALPQFFGSGKAGRLRSPDGFGTGVKSVTKSPQPLLPARNGNGHFDRHLRGACDVLGLRVGVSNVDTRGRQAQRARGW